MKIECIKDKLATAILNSQKITGKNLTLPVLSCILFEVKGSTLKIRATNLDLGIEIEIPVKSSEDGSVAVPGAVIANFISNLQDEKTITLETREGNLFVGTKSNSTLIKTMPTEDFPSIPIVEAERTFSVNGKDFVYGLKSVWYSSSTSSMKPELSSVYIYNTEDNMVFVATDSFRLAEKKIQLKKTKDVGSILIPYKNVPEICRLLENTNEDVEIKASKNQISFTYGGMYLVSRIIDGAFPDYHQIIPKETTTEVVLLKQDLIHSLKLSNIFGDKFNQVHVTALPKASKFELTTKNNDVGESVNTIQATLTGSDIEINFNYKYIVDCFQSIESGSVSLNFVGLNRPMVIRGVSDDSFTYLVMPMNK